MYEVSKLMVFSASHRLRNYHGKCEELHGHNWRVRVYVTGEKVDDAGILLDFKKLKDVMNEVVDARLDHKDLNSIPPFDEIEPSSELIAKYIFDEMAPKIDDDRVNVDRVEVWESDTSCATYKPTSEP